MRRLVIGAHTPDAGGIDMAARRAGAAGMRALQIFTAIPKFYGDKTGVRPERVDRFHRALAETEIRPEHVMAHAAYVLNVATPDAAKWERARAGLAKELERAATLGIGAVCFHPGAATDGDRDAGIERVARAMSDALARVGGTTRLLVENTAGAGNTIARSSGEIAAILAAVPSRFRDRTGYGLDSCHLFASGYDLTMSAEGVTLILDEFEAATGAAPAFFHLNDSVGALGSNTDRHALIGEGAIGEEPFRWLLGDRRAEGVPLILETPQGATPADDDPSPDPLDVRMVTLLERFSR
ncbi:MAG: deoxyribonuclease IV [Gemmatimonadaceae bacterium]